jgi:cell division protease FtsH
MWFISQYALFSILLYSSLLSTNYGFLRNSNAIITVQTRLFLNRKMEQKLPSMDNYISRESISELLDEVDRSSIKELYFTNDLKKIYSIHKKQDENDYSNIVENDISVVNSVPALVQNVLDTSRTHQVKTYILPEQMSFGSTLSQLGGVFSGLLSSLFYIALLYSVINAIRNQGQGNMPMGPFAGGGAGGRGGASFLNNRNNIDVKKDKEAMIKANITLQDWAGSPEIFEECNEVISYLRNSTNYEAAGATIPKGILLEGPPGTGKTLIAKAIASECDANFISVASSEFVELFVGLGAQKVRTLFNQARENTPCILFIDEIDSIGKQRGTGINMGNDEREQTLNQLLAEMDGFNDNSGILVIAATNRKDVLDSALLRPGRFDRIITVPLPDKESRKKIIQVHSRNKKFEDYLDYDFLAEMSAGFSGAQIKNFINEAAILTAREGRNTITQNDLENALEKLVVGIVKRIDTRSDTTRIRVAIHEAGHAFLSLVFTEYFELKKVTIQATYNGAGGYTLFNEKPEITESGLYTKECLKKRLVVAMGGKAAETVFYGRDYVSLGAVQDLKTANQLAQSMIGNYGMGETLEVFYNENTESGRNPFLGRSLAMGDKYSDNTKQIIDKESLELVQAAYDEAFQIITKYKNQIAQIAKLLIDNETVKYDVIQKTVIDPLIREELNNNATEFNRNLTNSG